MVGCAGPFFLYYMNSKAMGTDKSDFTTFTVDARLFEAFDAYRMMILTLEFVSPARI